MYTVHIFFRLEEEKKYEEAEKKYTKCLEINTDHPAGKEAMSTLNKYLFDLVLFCLDSSYQFKHSLTLGNKFQMIWALRNL